MMKRADAITKGVLATLIIAAASALVMAAAPPEATVPPAPSPVTLPRMVDLGAGKCIPCKKMAPIIEEMQKDYAAIVDIVFVDVWKNPKAGTPYKIRVIPTQVFFDGAGKEVHRHEGFMSREDIEKVFQEKMGVTPVKPAAKAPKSDSGAGLHPSHDALG